MVVMWNRKVFIRIIEVLLCIACVVALRVTDDESRRVFHYLRNRSREWSILNNVTWGSIGAALATATCGGYIIITTGLLIAAVTGELTGRITELFFLGLGIILLGIVGSLSLASIESVPDALIDNAAVLGALCLLTCLVFIADLLMGAPRRTKQQPQQQQQQQENQGTTFLGKETAVKKRPMISLENESKMNPDNGEDGGLIQNTRRTEASNGRSNEVFKHSEETSGRPDERHGEPDDKLRTSGDSGDESFAKFQRPKSAEVRHDVRQRDETQSRECATQNFENVQTLKDSRLYGGPERDTGDDDRRFSIRTDLHQRGARNFRDRPEDELDTPLFPRTRDTMPEPMFAQIVNPSVKIMRVERDPEETFDTRYLRRKTVLTLICILSIISGYDQASTLGYVCNVTDLWNSDSSHYDNVPTRMTGNPDDILKRHRDVSFNIPSPLRTHPSQVVPNHDDIEMLEEWINVLKTTTGMQTRRSPSSPNDPGYVKHTANNWPRDLKSKTPGSSPETRK